MISEKMQDAFNGQIKAELDSAYLYYSMQAYFAAAGLVGCEQWMKAQTAEEFVHAHKFVNFINERGGRVKLLALDEPRHEWDSPVAVFEEVAAHEAKVTGLINKLVDQAISESDHASNNFLQWFVGEQVEEEASADEVLTKMKMVKDSPGGLFQLDKELAGRMVTMTPDLGAAE
jgi:ferritin